MRDTNAEGTASPLIARRARVPRTISCATPPSTTAARPNMMSASGLCAAGVSTASSTSVASPIANGIVSAWRAEGVARARQRLGDEREERAPPDRERETDEDQVLDEEDRLAGEQGFEPVVRLQRRTPCDDEPDRRPDHEDDEPEEGRPQRRAPERVDRVEDPRAHEERAHDREDPRHEDEGRVP